MSNKIDSLDTARDLGYSIFKSVEYENLIKAEENYYNDPHATTLIKNLNNKLSEYSALGEDSVKEKEINELQQAINNNEAIQNFYYCKDKYDKLIKNINNIIKFITGEDERVSIDINSTNKGCSNCTGCCKK